MYVNLVNYYNAWHEQGSPTILRNDAGKSLDARMNMIWNDWSVHVLLIKAAGQILPVFWKCFGHVWPSCIQFQSSQMYDVYIYREIIDILDIIYVYMIRNIKIDYTRVCNISTRGTSCPSPRWEDGLLTEHRLILQKASWEFLLDPAGMKFGTNDVLSFDAWLVQCTNFLVLVEVDEGIRGANHRSRPVHYIHCI